ncbi:MAG: DUF2301 domain-containing membrane protein [Cyanobacteria bacterium P01_H01_bin.121]
MTTTAANPEPQVFEGQFGRFTIEPRDRWEVRLYRTGLLIAASAVAIATALIYWPDRPDSALSVITGLYVLFCLGLGLSLWTIHIYLWPLHRLLQLFWLIGCSVAGVLTFSHAEPLGLYVYQHPLSILGIGFSFAALTGIYFKEAFCFNRVETKFLTVLVPLLLLGHLAGWLAPGIEQGLLTAWAGLFVIFGLRKLGQPLAADIGDKSVFEYLKQQRQSQKVS